LSVSCITQLKAQGSSRTSNESKEEELAHGGRLAGPPMPAFHFPMPSFQVLPLLMHVVLSTQLTRDFRAEISRNAVTLSVRTQPCPCGIAFRRDYGSSTYRLFKNPFEICSVVRLPRARWSSPSRLPLSVTRGSEKKQATEKIRQRKGLNERVPIIAVTANAMKGDRDKCIEVEPQAPNHKPFSSPETHLICNTGYEPTWLD